MLNFRKRVTSLLENTSSLEAKNVCKELLEAFHNIPEYELSEAIVNKLKTISDSDKHVNKFIKVSEKLNIVSNLSVNESISKLKTCPIAGYTSFGYNLSRIENQVVSQNLPAYVTIDALVEAISSFTWEPAVKEIYENLVALRESNKEDILTMKGLYTLGLAKGNFLYNDAIAKLENHFFSPSEASRSSILESLNKFSYNPGVKELLEGIRKISASTGKTELISENKNVNIVPAYSFVHKMNETEEFFFVKGKVYKKTNESVSLATNEEFEALPSDFKNVFGIFNSPNIVISESKITVFAKRTKIELFESEGIITALVNGKSIPCSDVARSLVSTGILRIDESKYANEIQILANNFDKIFELDFVKVLESKIYEGLHSVIFNVANNLSVAKFNPAMKTDELIACNTINEARTELLNFLGYDIKESFSEFLDEEEKTLNLLKENQNVIISKIESLERELSKISESLKDPYIAGNEKVLELKAVLESELSNLKTEYSSIVESIKTGGKTLKGNNLPEGTYRDALDESLNIEKAIEKGNKYLISLELSKDQIRDLDTIINTLYNDKSFIKTIFNKTPTVEEIIDKIKDVEKDVKKLVTKPGNAVAKGVQLKDLLIKKINEESNILEGFNFNPDRQVFSAVVYTEQLSGHKFPNGSEFKYAVTGKPFVLYNKKGKGVLQLEIEGTKPNETINLCEIGGKKCLKTWNVRELEARSSRESLPSATLAKDLEVIIEDYFKSLNESDILVNEDLKEGETLEEKYKEVTTPAKYASLVDDIIATIPDAVKAAEVLQDIIYSNKESKNFVEKSDNIDKNKDAFNKFADHYKLLDKNVAKKVKTALKVNEAFGVRYTEIFKLNEGNTVKEASEILDAHKELKTTAQFRSFLINILSDVQDAEEAVKIVETALQDKEVYDFVKSNKSCKDLLDLFTTHYELDEKSWNKEVNDLFAIKESFKIDDMVKIISSDLTGTVTSIADDCYIILTDDGKTVEACEDDLTSLDADFANAVSKNNEVVIELSENLIELYENNKNINSALDFEHFIMTINRNCKLEESIEMIKKVFADNEELSTLIKESAYNESLNIWTDRYGIDNIKAIKKKTLV